MNHVLALVLHGLFGWFFIELGHVITEPYVTMLGVLLIYIGIVSVGMNLIVVIRKNYYFRHIG